MHGGDSSPELTEIAPPLISAQGSEQPAACTPFRGKVNASTRESLILNRPANGSVTQALIIQWFAVNGGSDDVHTKKCQDHGEISPSLSGRPKSLAFPQRMPRDSRTTTWFC